MSDRSYIPTRGIYPQKLTPVIDFTDEPIIQFDVPIVKHNFVDDCK